MDHLSVFVRDVPSNINPRKLKTILKQRPGGRAIVDVVNDGSGFRITFADETGLEEFLTAAPHTIEFGGTHRLSIETVAPRRTPISSQRGASSSSADNYYAFPYEPRTKYHWSEITKLGWPGAPESRCLLVRNIGENQDGPTIKRFFENERRTGGGPVQNVLSMHDGAVVVFEDERRVDAAMALHGVTPLKFSSNDLVMHVKKIPPIYEDRLVISRVPEDASSKEEDIKFRLTLFIEEVSGDSNEVTCERVCAGTYLAIFKQAMGSQNLQEIVRKIVARKDVQETALLLTRTDILEVKSTQPIPETDLQRFFSNRKRSGGGPVTCVMRRSPSRSHVFFASYEDAENSERHIKSRTPCMLGTFELQVQLYHSCLDAEGEQNYDKTVDSARPITGYHGRDDGGACAFDYELGDEEKLIFQFIKNNAIQKRRFDENFVTLANADTSKDGVVTFASPKNRSLDRAAFERDCKEKLVKFLSGYSYQKKVYSQENLNTARRFHEEPRQDFFSRNPTEKVSVRWSSATVHVVGEKDVVEKTAETFVDLIEKCRTLKVTLPKEKASLLDECDAWENMKGKIEEYGVKCIRESSTIFIGGHENETKFGKFTCENYFKTFNRTQIADLDADRMQFLRKVLSHGNADIKKSILSKIHSAGIKATLMVEGTAIYLTSPMDLSYQEKLTTKQVLESTIEIKTIVLDNAKMAVVKERNWLDLVDEVSRDGSVDISVKGSTVILVGRQSSFRNVEPRLGDHFDKNVVHTRKIPCKCGEAKFAVERSNQFSPFQCEQRGIKCTVAEDGGILLEGKKLSLAQAEVDAGKLLSTINERSETLENPGAYEYFHSDTGKKFISDTEVLTNVTMLLDSPVCENCQKEVMEISSSVDMAEKSVTPLTITPLISGISNKKREVTISVWKGDITEHDCDAIVNPTDDKMALGGMLSSIISKKGGKSIEAELRKTKKFRLGDAIATTAGNLKSCKNIIHVAVPRWGNTSNYAKLLQSCVDESLKLANKKGMKTVVFPALCCGGASADDVEDILSLIFKSLEDHLEKIGKYTKFSVQEVQFMESQNETVIEKLTSLTKKSITSSNTKNKDRPTAKETLVKTVLRLGDIALAKADVIVNTTPAEHAKQLSGGAVSAALRKQCGESVIKECQKLKGPFQPGSVWETSGGNLHCKMLYHAITMKWDDKKSEEIVRDIVMKVLRKCDKGGFSSVVIPAIGTGGFKYPPKKVAFWMRKEIQSFSGTCLTNVTIILYPSDRVSIQAFENEFKQNAVNQGQTTSSSSVPATRPGRANANQKTTKYGDITVSVYQGDITTERVDAIVNSTNDRFDLSLGYVSQAILSKGGSQIQNEVNSSKTGDMFKISSGGKLPCTKIIHVNFPQSEDDKMKALLDVLMEGEAQNWHNISIPALGTGINPSSINDVATLMSQCFQTFAKQNPTKLMRINVVIFRPEMLPIFQSVISNSATTKMAKFMGMVGLGEWWQGKKEQAINEEIPPNQEKKLLLYMYSDNDKNLEKAVQSLKGELSKVCADHTMQLEAHDTLTPMDIGYLKKTHKINIEKHQTEYINDLVLSGMAENLVKAIPAIKEYIQAIGQAKKSIKLVMWKHSLDGNEWEQFSETDGIILEKEYQKRKLNTYEASETPLELVGDSAVKVDFQAWTLSSVPPREISREDIFGTSEVELPDNWEKIEDGKKGVMVVPHCREYNEVKNKLRGYRISKIVSVKRIQNLHQYTQFVSKRAEVKKKLEKYNSTNPVVRELYHGTTCADAILENGFDRGHAGKNATVYGRGVYFAVEPSYSHRYTDKTAGADKTMFIADVITGDYCLGSGDMVTPPARSPTNKTELYDSVVDDESSPAMFVVFRDASVFPKYLVTYKSD